MTRGITINTPDRTALNSAFGVLDEITSNLSDTGTLDAAYVDNLAATVSALLPSTSVFQSPRKATMKLVINEEVVKLNTVATTTTTAGLLLPANSLILAVTFQPISAISGFASYFEVGDGTTANRFSAAVLPTTSAVCLSHFQGSVATDAAGPVQGASAAAVVLTAVGGLPAAGTVAVTVFAMSFVPASGLY